MGYFYVCTPSMPRNPYPGWHVFTALPFPRGLAATKRGRKGNGMKGARLPESVGRVCVAYLCGAARRILEF